MHPYPVVPPPMPMEKRVPHFGHFLLTLFTAGLWIPVWGIHAGSVHRANTQRRKEYDRAVAAYYASLPPNAFHNPTR